MNNLIDYRVSPEKLENIRNSQKKTKHNFKFLSIFSTFVLLIAVVASAFIYTSNQQKAEAIQFGLGNNYEEIVKMNEEMANNVPLSIDSITTSSAKGDKRVVALMMFFQKYNSPMASASVAKAFVDGADNNGFGHKWTLLPAIAGIESAFGRLIPHNGKYPSYNAWGWSGGSKYGRWSYFASWEDAATRVSKGIADGYRNTGFDPVKMMGIYCPPCGRPEAKGIWARTVNTYIAEMESIYRSL